MMEKRKTLDDPKEEIRPYQPWTAKKPACFRRQRLRG